jgi:predicted transposase YdaD
LVLYAPGGQRFSSFVELGQAVQQERSRAEQAELAIQAAVPRLLGLGLTVEQVASALGLAVEQVMGLE